MKRFQISLLALLSFFALSEVFAAAEPNSQIRFNRDIRPILADACFHCHGPDPGSRKGGLRLDREESLYASKGDDGPIVIKGKPEASPLYKRLISTDPEEVMPPPKANHKLTDKEKEAIKSWIAQGAPWEAHWSFIKPERPNIPQVVNETWARNSIDKFVLAKLESMKLQPAPEADKRTIARRLALDLTGLPPKPEMVEAFVADNSADAYEKLVDKLMAMPQYGEHRARFWLDAARYADTHGLHFDNYREIWPYRDWVINAFNRNEPFDQFTIEQLAGDLLPNPTKDQIIATGFHRCTVTTNEGGTIAEENLCNYARERVEATSWVFLGLTANCAVCHDHKFDPITMKDFYSMSAFFRNTTQGALDGNVKDTAPILMMPKPEDEKRSAEIPKEIEDTNKAIADKKKELRPEFEKWLENVKISEWEESLAKSGNTSLHLPLNDGAAGNGIAEGQTVAPKSAEPLKWEDGGQLGKAPIFTDKTKFEVGNYGDFDKDQKFSYGCWVKLPKGGGSAAILGKMDEAADYRGWDLWNQDNEFGAHLINKWESDAIKVVTTGNQVKRGQWQHVFVTYDGSGKAEGFKIYVDGKDVKLKFEKNQLKSTTKTTAPLFIGQRKTSSAVNGAAIQDVRLYNRRVTLPEIKKMALLPKIRTILAKAAKDRSAKEKDELFDSYISENAELLAANEKLAALESEKKTIKDRSVVTLVQEEKKNSMPVANILMRGEYDKPKDKVEANVFGALHPMPANAPKSRLGLAQWIVSPENPITPRVIVNRMWQEFFGTGLVKTSEDFGIMGEAPSHPELLDFLAVEFRDGGWDMKKMIKSIVMSAAYRQAPITTKEKLEKDPANRYLARGPKFRMDAEMIRDYALATSGLLVEKIGGPSVKPYQPENVWEVVGMPESNTRHYKRDNGENLYRRSMYTFWKRAAPPASMEILNAPNREVSCVRRERTNTPLQALVTMNDPQFVEAARVLAQNAMKGANDDNARIDFVARRVLCRPLNDKEMSVVAQIQKDLITHYKAKPEDAKALISVGESKPDNALEPATLAAWTMVCNQMFNLDEALTK